MSFRFSLPESNKAAERPEIDSHQLSPETGREEGSTATSELSEPQDVEKDPNEKYIAVAQLNPPQDDESRRYGVPSMEITFTCKPCYRRSTHRISKHGYFKGSVLITCPNCKARHVITDHLKVRTTLHTSLWYEVMY
jgi:superfamily II helicase